MLTLPQGQQQTRSRMTLIVAAVVGLLASAGSPSMAAAADVQGSVSQKISIHKADHQAANPAVVAESATYAQRETVAKDLEHFKGGGAGIYIGGSSAAVILLIVLLILIL